MGYLGNECHQLCPGHYHGQNFIISSLSPLCINIDKCISSNDIGPIEEQQHLTLFAVYGTHVSDLRINITMNVEEYTDKHKDVNVKTFFIRNPPDNLNVNMETTDSHENVIFLYWVNAVNSTLKNVKEESMAPGTSRTMTFFLNESYKEYVFSLHIYYKSGSDLDIYLNLNDFASPYRHMGTSYAKSDFMLGGSNFTLLSTIFTPINATSLNAWIENVSGVPIKYIPDISLTKDYEFKLENLNFPYIRGAPSTFAHFTGMDLLSKIPSSHDPEKEVFHLLELETQSAKKFALAYQELMLKKQEYPTIADYDQRTDKVNIEESGNKYYTVLRLAYSFIPSEIVSKDVFRLKHFSYFYNSEREACLMSTLVFPKQLVITDSHEESLFVEESWTLFKLSFESEKEFVVFEITSPACQSLDLYSNRKQFPTADINEHQTHRSNDTQSLYFCTPANSSLLVNIFNFKEQVEPFNVKISIKMVDECKERKINQSITLIVVLCCILGALLVVLIISFLYSVVNPPNSYYLTPSEENVEKIKYMPLEIESLKDPQPVDFDKIPYVRATSPNVFNDYGVEEDEEEDFISP